MGTQRVDSVFQLYSHSVGISLPHPDSRLLKDTSIQMFYPFTLLFTDPCQCASLQASHSPSCLTGRIPYLGIEISFPQGDALYPGIRVPLMTGKPVTRIYPHCAGAFILSIPQSSHSPAGIPWPVSQRRSHGALWVRASELFKAGDRQSEHRRAKVPLRRELDM